VVGIVLAFLNRTGRRDKFWAVWAGTSLAIAISVAVAALLFVVGAELEGRSEKLFEGATMLLAACLLTWMIFWMRRQARTIKRELELHVAEALAKGSVLGLALVAFVGVLREGVEAALLLFGATENSTGATSTISGLVGLALALMLGYLFYRGTERLDLRRFFTITSVLLLLFAGWLLAGGLHELAEAGLLPDNEALLVGAFLALAVPTVLAFLRRPKAKPIVPQTE
jgi:high-affinity iron transporter